MTTKADLTKALAEMVETFGPGSFVPEKADALRRARIALGTALPWEYPRKAGNRSLKAKPSQDDTQ